MASELTIHFAPLSTTPKGVLVVFCDDQLKFGAATRRVLQDCVTFWKRFMSIPIDTTCRAQGGRSGRSLATG